MARTACFWAYFARLGMTFPVVVFATDAMHRAAAQAIVRVAAWNTANKPYSTENVETFHIIVNVVENDSVNGSANWIDAGESTTWQERD